LSLIPFVSGRRSQFAQVQPLTREIQRDCRSFGIGQHAPRLLRQNLWLVQLFSFASRSSSSSGMLLQRKKESRDASSISVTA